LRRALFGFAPPFPLFKEVPSFKSLGGVKYSLRVFLQVLVLQVPFFNTRLVEPSEPLLLIIRFDPLASPNCRPFFTAAVETLPLPRPSISARLRNQFPPLMISYTANLSLSFSPFFVDPSPFTFLRFYPHHAGEMERLMVQRWYDSSF